MWQTGHSLIKAKLRETGAPFAGEMSGHLFFKERWYGFDDGLYAAVRLLEILSRSEDPNGLLESLPDAPSTPELKLVCDEGEHVGIVEQLKLQGLGAFGTAQSWITIDGIRVEYDDGFGLARPSNTTPVVVMRFEADSEQALARIQSEFRSAFASINPQLELPF
jgi:phosphomannomutase/phosphoglucomutase